MGTENKAETKRYSELDTLRGLAALLVVLCHLTMNRPGIDVFGFRFGITGVDLFFIISGFVIYLSIQHVTSTREFIVNRISRLYPTYWICVTITFILQLLASAYFGKGTAPTFGQYAANMTMFNYYMNVPNLDGPYWTMIIEMLFYIFIAILLALRAKKHLLPVSVLMVYFILQQYILGDTPYWPYYLKVRATIPLFNHFCLFFSGIVFYKIITEKENRFLLYTLLLLAFTFQVIQENGNDFVSHREYFYTTAVYFLLFILFVNGWLKFLVWKPTLFLGKISFALYLVHQFICHDLLLPYFVDRLHMNFWIAAGICLVVVISLATLITYYVEIPFGKKLNVLLRKLFRIRPKRPNNPVPAQSAAS